MARPRCVVVKGREWHPDSLAAALENHATRVHALVPHMALTMTDAAKCLRELTDLIPNPTPGEQDAHRQWALANVRQYTDERRCGHGAAITEHMRTCVECAHEVGRLRGQMEAGAFYTHEEVFAQFGYTPTPECGE